jgi:excisionase family DNA binding protein
VSVKATKHQPLALSIEDAARVLSVSRDSFERHVMKELRLVRVGRRLLVPVRELDRWLEHRSAIPLVAELSNGSRRQSRPRGRIEL